MRKVKFLLIIFSIVGFAVNGWAQPATNYYTSSTLDGKNGRDLEVALAAIINTHTQISYDDVDEQFVNTDVAPTDSLPSGVSRSDLVWDMYAWISQFPKYYDVDNHLQTGGFNKEHIIPNSWWGGEDGNSIAYSDMYNLVPGDGAANSAKSNWPLGEYKSGMTLSWPTADKTGNTNYTKYPELYNSYYVYADASSHTSTSLGAKCTTTSHAPASHVWTVSNSSNYGGASKVFEPADQYKGDLARSYLYMVCAYEGKLTWSTTYMFGNDSQGYTTINDWAKELLLKWCRQDPVSDKERDRNDAVEKLQKNRNPFVDYPELIEYIWGDKTSSKFSLADAVSSYSDEYEGGGSGDSGDSGDTETKNTSTLMLVLSAKVGEAFNGIVYNSNSDGSATYSSSDTNVATVDSKTGAVTIVGAGTTIITYTIAGSASYNAASVSYKIVVTE